MLRNMQLVHLATGSMQLRPIFQPGTLESMGPWAAAIFYLFMKLVNCLMVNFLNGNNGLNE